MRLSLTALGVAILPARSISPVAAISVLAMLLLTPSTRAADSGLNLTSPAFAPGMPIPAEYICSGDNHSPALKWTGAPPSVASFALIAEDPDAVRGNFVHWVIFNLPPDATGIAAHAPTTRTLSDGAMQGENGMGSVGYTGPCPPPGKVHHYRFELFALDSKLAEMSHPDATTVLAAMRDHVKASAELVGTFER